MNEYAKYNYYNLLNLKYSRFIILLITFLIIIILYFALYNSYFYDSITLEAKIDNNILIVNVPINNSDTIKNGEYLIINKTKMTYKIIGFETSHSENIFKLNIKYEKFKQKKEKIVFYYNKQRILNVILKMFM
jgi:hypothetical protein